MLVPKGQLNPSGIGDAMIVRTPVESFVSLSTTYLPFLEQIGALELVAVEFRRVYLQPFRCAEQATGGAVSEVGSGAVGINVERLI